jgi:hypothetical protein
MLFGLVVMIVTKFTTLSVLHVINAFINLIVGSAFSIFWGGVMAAYVAAVIRILENDKRRADPNFALTTRR